MTPDPDYTRPVEPGTFSYDPALAAAFGPDLTPGGFTLPPLLRDDPSELAAVVQPSSAEMPKAGGQRYQLHGEIARGGMGVVLKGRDPDLGRDLAFKVLRGELAGKPAAIQRFVEEAQIGGQLQHPGVVPVYDLGRFADGRPYFAMKLVKGRTLADLFAARKSPADDRGRMLHTFLQVCQTVAYAHAKGVIHRDLKPSNVMVGGFGEVLVMDWGLAKVLPRGGIADEEKASLASGGRKPPGFEEPTVIQTARSGSGSGSETQAGSVMGTPAFMPPEQAGGEIDKLDERADVFGLGAMLCVLLTGQPPYVAASGDEVRLMAVRGKLADAFARLDGCGADAELVALCKRCLSAEREDRPRNAGEIATGVTAHLAAVEQRAHRAEVERAAADARAAGEANTRRMAEAKAVEERRRRRAQAAFGLAFTALVVLGGLGLWWGQEQRRTRDEEDRGRREKTERELQGLIEDAVSRYGRARGADRDPSLWAEARSAAKLAEERAEAADAPPEVRGRIQRLVAEIDQLEKNRRLVATLLEIQASMGDDLLENGNQNFPAADLRYEQALREYGADLFKLNPEQAADLLGTLGDSVRVRLASALDDWGYVRHVCSDYSEMNPAEVPGRTVQTHPPAHLFAITCRLDPDPLRNRIRQAAIAKDKATLNEIARSLDPAIQPVQTVNLVAVFLFHFNLSKNPSQTDTLTYLQKVYPHHSGDFQICHNLAFILNWVGRYPDALPFATGALAIRPQSAAAWHDRARALAGLNRFAEAGEAFRRVFALSPKNALAHVDFGSLLARNGDRDGATGEFQEALRIAPTANIHNFVAVAFYQNRDWDRAITYFREAIRIDPTDATIHSNLGTALRERGDWDGAMNSFRKALEIDPKMARASWHLGNALEHQGHLDSAIDAYKKGLVNTPEDVSLVGALRKAERIQELLALVPDILAGKTLTKTRTEVFDLAWACGRPARGRYRDAVKLYEHGFASRPNPADGPFIPFMQYQYPAACSAVMAASGAGADAPTAAAERAALRAKALNWLRADLAQTRRLLNSRVSSSRTVVAAHLTPWLQDPQLASVRPGLARIGIPAAERADWDKFWSDVKATMADAQNPSPREVLPPPREDK